MSERQKPFGLNSDSFLKKRIKKRAIIATSCWHTAKLLWPETTVKDLRPGEEQSVPLAHGTELATLALGQLFQQ